MPKLSITFPSGEKVTHEMSEETIKVGRRSDNDLVLDDVSVSSSHAELTFKGGDYLLTDLNSTNGTKVNAEKGSEWELQDGDLISFGKVLALYTSEIPSAKHSLPESASLTAELGQESHRPSDFTNASRFKSKSKKKDPAGLAIVGVFVVALLVFVGAIVNLLLLQPPT